MNQFIVVFNEPYSDMIGASNALIADKYELSDSVLLLRSVLDSPQQVAAQFNMSDEASGTLSVGVVLKLEGSYYGYNDPSLWNWLSKAHVIYSA